jgi:TonB-dependent receptor
MNSPSRPLPARIVVRLTFALVVLISLSKPAFAQSTGTIEGRVFNPATGEYVRNAEVRVQGIDRPFYTDNEGAFRVDPVRPGATSVSIRYVGYQPVTEAFEVVAGGTTRREINIVGVDAGTTQPDGTITLQKFVVSSDREGNAKAIMEQRRSMNIINSVASDAFGDIGESNVGEFLKNIPGIELEYVDSIMRAPRIRGMEPQYSAILVDGVRVAAADGQMAFGNTENGEGGESVRSPGMEAVSLNNIDSIEVSKTLSADMDADAPAGTINFKSKRAFDRKGRRIGWQARLALNSEEFTLDRTWGPKDSREYKASPSGQLEFSDVFLNQRLGLMLSVNKSRDYAENYSIDSTVNRTPTAADPRPAVITGIVFRDQGSFKGRSSVGATADFKATPALVLSLTADYNFYAVESFQRASNVATGARETVVGNDPMMSFETSNAGAAAARAMGMQTNFFNKDTTTLTLIPRLEYKRGNLLLEAKGSYSGARNIYHMHDEGIAGIVRTGALTNINFRAVRTDPTRQDWTITQLSGPSWTDLANFPLATVSETARLIKEKRYTGQADARYDTKLPWLSWLKSGVKWTEMNRKHLANANPRKIYVGPGAGPAFMRTVTSPNPFDMGTTGALFRDASGSLAPPAMANNQALGGLLRDHPEFWVDEAVPAATYYNEQIRDKKYIGEEGRAAFVMGHTRIERLQVQAGLRWEQTEVSAREPDPLLRSELLAAGIPVDANGRATTIAGLDYQYLSRPFVTRTGEVDRFFPSASAKYMLGENLAAHVGYNQAISRPPVNQLAGVWTINEAAQTVTVPNPNLKPEFSDNYSARLSYYFEPVGNVAVGVFQNDITNLRETTEYAADEFGYGDDPVYGSYRFFTQANGDGARRFRGLEVEYGQHLSFLPGILRGLNISGSYVRNYASLRRPALVPHRLTGAVGFRYRSLTLRFSTTWMDDTPWLTSTDAFQPAKTSYDFSGGYQFSPRLGFFFAGRNLTDEPRRINQYVDATRTSSYLLRYSQIGAMWTFGLKGTF